MSHPSRRTAARRRVPRGIIYMLWCLPLLILGHGAGLAVDDCPDAWISTKISMRLSAKIGVYAARINPETEMCVVTLRGCVSKTEHRRKALITAGKIKKVKQVIDEMTTCDDD